MVFPVAFMANTFSMMVVMIGLSLFGRPELAADFGLIHGATVALFYSLSGNSRSLILAESAEVDAAGILRLRLIMLLPLALLAWMLCIGVVEGGWLFVLLLVFRRAAEWLAEVFLSEQELNHQSGAALRFLLLQGGLSLVLLLALLGNEVLATPVMLVWALSPLLGCMSLSLLRRSLQHAQSSMGVIRVLLPHFGSTVVIGVSVYVFRLFILLVAGREVAGDLFSAFAFGGMLGAVFSQALGPTMVRHELQQVRPGFSFKVLNLLLVATLFAGTVLGLSVWSEPGLFHWTSKSNLFWFAVSFSLVGGVVMVFAQKIRLRLLQNKGGRDVFGSDMLANLLLVGCVPIFFYMGGEAFLVTLYCVGALLSLVFYASESGRAFIFNDFLRGRGWLGGDAREDAAGSRASRPRWFDFLLVFSLFVPLFFQFANGIYQAGGYFNSGGSLALLPVPLSVLGCFLGIVLLGEYTKSRLGFVVVFFSVIGMFMSAILLATGGAADLERSKLILLAQYALPMFALVLGLQFGAANGSVGRLGIVLFCILLAIVPLQLFATWFFGAKHLSASIFVFGIYQHLQYVPVLFCGAYLIALFSLWKYVGLRYLLLLLGGLMGAYSALSVSVLSIFFVFVGVFFFALRSIQVRNGAWLSGFVLVSVVVGMWLGFFYLANVKLLAAKFGALHVDGQIEGPENLQERLIFWRYYLEGVGEGVSSFLFGHEQAPARDQYPSAHNYYLDFIYNFGFLALLPIFTLLGWTCWRVLRCFHQLWLEPGVLGVAGVVIFLLLEDNLFKVGMRQPYSGIITFFLWGVLLAYLIRWSEPRSAESAEFLRDDV